MTIKLEPNTQGARLLDELILFSEVDPESIADMLGLDPTAVKLGAMELLLAANSAKR